MRARIRPPTLDPGGGHRTKGSSHAADPTDVGAPERADAGGRATARTPPRHHEGVVPAPSWCRGAAAGTSTDDDSWARSPRRAPTRHAVALTVNLLTEDNLRTTRSAERRRPRRRVGRVAATMDRRGGAPLDRDPRLPHGHPGGGPGRARTRLACNRSSAGSSPSSTTAGAASCTRRSRSSRRGSRTATPASCSRRPGRADDHAARRRRREPAPSLLPRPRRRGDRDRSVGDGDRDGPGRAGSRCRAPGSRTSPGSPA